MSDATQKHPIDSGAEMLITFLYFKDMPRIIQFYEDVMGFKLAIDQGWSRIYRVSDSGYVGLVDETRGHHRASPTKPVQICMRVPDVDLWYRYLAARGVDMLREPRENQELKIKAFVLQDPEGYTIEIQQAL